jgi:hypothetical protein
MQLVLRGLGDVATTLWGLIKLRVKAMISMLEISMDKTHIEKSTQKNRDSFSLGGNLKAFFSSVDN